jgi:hypothetical protein
VVADASLRPVRGVGVGLGANTGSVTAGKGVGVGSVGWLGRTTTGAGTTGLAVSGEVAGGMTWGSG